MKKTIPLFTSLTLFLFLFTSMGTIDLANLYNEIATLGRVLFYDKQLSLNNTISCGSCHIQAFAFGDTATVSTGFNGELTTRHAPRLINLSYNFRSEIFYYHK